MPLTEKQICLYNVKKVVLTPLDDATGLPKTDANIIEMTTAEEVEATAKYSDGEEKTLRVDNEILAVAEQEDLLISYDVKLKDATFNMDILQLIEGGTVTLDDKKNIIGYKSPMLADNKYTTPFKMDLYVAEYRGTQIKRYVKITFNYCKAKTPSLSFKKDFYSPELNIVAKENSLAVKPIKEFEYVASIPKAVVKA